MHYALGLYELCRTANFTLRKFHTVKNWYEFLTAREILEPIRHVLHTNISHFVKKTHVVKLYVAYVRIFHIDKILPNLLHFSFDSNSSHAGHYFITGAVLTGYM